MTAMLCFRLAPESGTVARLAAIPIRGMNITSPDASQNSTCYATHLTLLCREMYFPGRSLFQCWTQALCTSQIWDLPTVEFLTMRSCGSCHQRSMTFTLWATSPSCGSLLYYHKKGTEEPSNCSEDGLPIPRVHFATFSPSVTAKVPSPPTSLLLDIMFMDWPPPRTRDQAANQIT